MRAMLNQVWGGGKIVLFTRYGQESVDKNRGYLYFISFSENGSFFP